MKAVAQFPIVPKAGHAPPDGARATVVERRLAAILMADVVGYSRLVGADEYGTLRRWRAHWDEFIAPTIVAHQGRIARINGDGILTEFASVVNAARCAVALQAGMLERNAAVAAPERIEFRIGLNVGDVIIDRGDMWGEGVNVAARLQALAQPGGLCVSAPVHEVVADKLDIAFEDLGTQQLKNIARPVRIYHAQLAHTTAHARDRVATSMRSLLRANARGAAFAATASVLVASLVAGAWWLASSPASPLPSHPQTRTAATREAIAAPSRPAAPVASIVVLPFINLSGDAKQDHVADAITDSLISDLARALPGAIVISRDTAFTYKGRAADARQVGRELEVRYLLEGSVVPTGEQVRVNIQLVDTQDGNALWTERFDTERKAILQVQDEIVGRVSRAIGLKVVDIEARRSLRERPGSGAPADLVLRGKAALNLPSSPATMLEARGFFERALEAQPGDVDGLAGVATTLVFEFLNGYYEWVGDKRLRRAELLLDRALAIEPRHLMGLKAKAALRRARGRFDDAISIAEAVIMENPGEPWAYKEIGLSTLYLGRPLEALDWFARAERIGPRDPGRWTWLDGRGHALILLGRDEEAVRALNGALDANPKNASSRAFLAAAYALSGRLDEATVTLAEYDQQHPGTRISTFRTLSPVPLALTSPEYQRQRARLNEGLRKAGMAE